MAGFHQLPGVFGIEIPALCLNVRAVIAADIRTLVIVKAGLVHGLVDEIHGTRNLALLIRVLNAQDELAAVLAGKQIGIKRRAEAAQVEITGRAGRKACTNYI